MQNRNILLRLSVGLLFLVSISLRAEDPTANLHSDQMWQQAEQRIEQHRKTDVVITVVDSQGNPVSDTEVHVEQTRHQFLFGCNIFKWQINSDVEWQQQYRDRFAALLNFATIGYYWPSWFGKSGGPIRN